MKAGIVMTGTGAILVLTACNSFEDPPLARALREKGITRYIAMELPMGMVKNVYGSLIHFALSDPRDTSDVCKVIDVDGARIFRNFPLNVLGSPIFHDEEEPIRRAA